MRKIIALILSLALPVSGCTYNAPQMASGQIATKPEFTRPVIPVSTTKPASEPYHAETIVSTDRKIISISWMRSGFVQSSNYKVGRWDHEVRKRFDKAVILYCHGENLRNEWTVLPEQVDGTLMPVNKAVMTLKQDYPGFPIVLIVCNPHAMKLGIPDVYYAKTNVWITPDSTVDVPTGNREIKKNFGSTGDIWEFNSD